ncbi:stage III sporulation protein AE [uncultured Tyzzerella sp.]|uniref:stage III sporulation protein AE n=1 Tax=uncultured Tyzzerella sp. TaxID=2321398 RepID=UPI002943AA29|nr:stage III sporulation protein AE [uncultured Tyzzerella sp.]
MKKFLLIIILIIVFSKNIYANDYISEGLNILNIEQYDTIINENIYKNDFKFSDIARDILSGKSFSFNIYKIINYILKSVFEEVFINSKIIKNVILIGFLAAFFKVLTDSFKNQGVAEIGFYTTYMVISMLLATSFNIVVEILYNTVNSIANIINGTMPILIGLLAMSGASASSTIFSSFILASLGIVSFFIKNIFIPLISGTVILNIINYIMPKEVLNKLIEFLKWLINFSLRSLAMGLGFIISLQRIGAPILNGVVNKTAKTFISFVPVVGDVMTGAIDSIMYFVGILKSGIGIAIVIIIIICAIVPIIKLVALILIYKIAAVLIEPITDTRITSCVDTMGEYTKLVLSSLIIFLILFIFFIVIMLSVTG